jgi:hypothetical protein
MTTRQRPRFIGLAAILLAAALASAPPASAKPPGSEGNASFPHDDVSWSPDARFVLKNVEQPADPSAPHAIYLTDMRTGARSVLYPYLRKVEVLWSPASNALAINDWGPNDVERCIVLELVPRRRTIDMSAEVAKSRSPESAKMRRDPRDDSLHIVRWTDPRTLVVDVQSRHSDGRRTSIRLRQRIFP